MGLRNSNSGRARNRQRLQRITAIQKAIHGELPALEWVRKFLIAARATKSMHLLSGVSAGTREEAKLRESHETALKQCREERQLDDPFLAEDRLVIVAGGCDAQVEDRMQSYRGMFDEIFEQFEGTVFSGCTEAGVDKLVGDLSTTGKRMRKIAYVPTRVPSRIRQHRAYERVYTSGDDFSPLDPIQNWIDIPAQGVNPTTVRLLGVNGGRIAGIEYRIAAALGAKAGILAGSGREATRVLEDPGWIGTPGLIRLPDDRETLRLFICGCQPSRDLAGAREQLAKSVHEQYRDGQLHGLARNQVHLQDWQDLPENLKESGESAEGTAPSAALRTGREPLSSSGSHHPADGRMPICQ